MAVVHQSVVYDVNDFKVYAMETDTIGGSPTYGAAVDVPGISDVNFEPEIVSAELKGDATVIAVRGRITKLKGTATYGKLALDVLGVIMGGAVSDPDGSTAQWTVTAPNSLPRFKSEFKCEDVEAEAGVGDLHVQLFKCVLTGGTLLTQSSDNFGKPSFQFDAIQPLNPAHPIGLAKYLSAATDLSA